MCQSLPAEAMHDIWNPAAGLFPFLLLCSSAGRSRAATPACCRSPALLGELRAPDAPDVRGPDGGPARRRLGLALGWCSPRRVALRSRARTRGCGRGRWPGARARRRVLDGAVDRPDRALARQPRSDRSHGRAPRARTRCRRRLACGRPLARRAPLVALRPGLGVGAQVRRARHAERRCSELHDRDPRGARARGARRRAGTALGPGASQP